MGKAVCIVHLLCLASWHIFFPFFSLNLLDLCSEKRGGAVRIRHKTLPRSPDPPPKNAPQALLVFSSSLLTSAAAFNITLASKHCKNKDSRSFSKVKYGSRNLECLALLAHWGTGDCAAWHEVLDQKALCCSIGHCVGS